MTIYPLNDYGTTASDVYSQACMWHYGKWKKYACGKKAHMWPTNNWGTVTGDPTFTNVTLTGWNTWPTQTASGNIDYQWPSYVLGGTQETNYQASVVVNWYGNDPCYYEWNYVVETEEQRLAREAQALAANLKREAATKRAEELLLVCLTAEQRKQYAELGYFDTLVNDKVYRINKGRSGNVQLIEAGVPKAKFCIHPREFIPDQDTMLAQLLMLRTDEAEFLKLANRTILHP